MTSKAATKARANKAIKEMKGCGFPSAKTKVVLKSLLKSFDNSWEMIEKDNYSVLVDALISHEEDQGFIQKSNDAIDDEDLEKKEENIKDETALCRKKVGSQEEQEPSPSFCNEGALETVLKMPNSEKHNSTGNTIKQALIGNTGAGADLGSAHGRCKGKEIVHTSILPKMNPCDIGVVRKRSTLDHVMTSKDNNLRYSGPPNGTTNESKEDPLESSSRNDTSVVSLGSSTKHIDIASSSNGKVRLSFSFDNMSSDISFLDMQSIFREVEYKCLKSYKIIDPNFSLMNLMTELCQMVLELSESPKQNRLSKVSPMLDSLKRYGEPKVSSGASTIKKSGVLNNASLSLVPVPQNEPALGHIRPLHDSFDISKGEERVRISIINNVDHEQYPASFFYIPQNIVYQNGHVDFSLARIGDEDCCSNCFGDCLSASLPCACARETGGEYAYTPDGLIKKEFLNDRVSRFHNPQKQHFVYCKDCPLERLKNDISPSPCKGHLVQKFIKECWVKCGCNKQCGNRVVQRGVTCNLQVFYTAEGKGWGLRTLDELPSGTFVCEYVGEVITNMELYERTMKLTGNAKHTYPVLLDADWGSEGILKDEEALCLDATFYGNIARFINHRCFDSNLIEIPVEIETPDHHYYHLAFFTKRKVEPFEELTWDYGIDFDDQSHPVKAFECRCRSRYCRNVKKQFRKRPRASALT